MATGTFDGVRELRSRLPNVSDTVIAYFLSKYNVEECYERLKNGYDESAELNEDLDSSSFYPPSQTMDNTHNTSPLHQTPTKTNAQMSAEERTVLPQDQPWSNYPIHPSQSWPQVALQSQLHGDQLPYPSNDRHNIELLIADQKKQIEHIHKIRELYKQDIDALRSDASTKRQTLTRLRIEASEGPTTLDIAGVQDIISTLEYDIHVLQNKIQIEQTQAEMKERLDVYTEEGVRWSCKQCKFLNHPLMSRCESCDQLR